MAYANRDEVLLMYCRPTQFVGYSHYSFLRTVQFSAD